MSTVVWGNEMSFLSTSISEKRPIEMYITTDRFCLKNDRSYCPIRPIVYCPNCSREFNNKTTGRFNHFDRSFFESRPFWEYYRNRAHSGIKLDPLCHFGKKCKYSGSGFKGSGFSVQGSKVQGSRNGL